MATNSTPLNLDVPNFGTVPVEVNHESDLNSPGTITHRTPSSHHTTDDDDLRLRFKNQRIVPFPDLKSRIPQYAVQQQKLVILTATQLSQLAQGDIIIGTASEEGERIREQLNSLNRQHSNRISVSDCPEPELSTNGELLYTVLLDWEEKTATPFPDLLLRTIENNVERVSRPEQVDNFLLSGAKDSNDPPARPPVGSLGRLNSQPSDFRPASAEDITHYQQQIVQDKSPAVAVIDTGLKFNLLNRNEENQWPTPYKYRDADGQEKPFILAYQDPTAIECKNPVNPFDLSKAQLGYCAVQSYRQETVINSMLPLMTTEDETDFSLTNILNSPFDDFRILRDPGAGPEIENVVDARHGTTVTAIIQQNGDDTPVVPVKTFDNLGFATLFDVLNGFNYVLQRCKSSNIKVVNVSWIFLRDEPLLKKKIEQLMQAGVFVVAAAGNEGQTLDRNLDNIQAYPACYSQCLPNVITATSVRKTYFPPNLIAQRGDSIISKALSHAIEKVGLFGLLDTADHMVEKILPTAGYVAVENYSTTYVNVGVVSTFGYFRSPFWNSPIIRGSSFASAFVTAFVIRQLRNNPDWVPAGQPVSKETMQHVREQLLQAMSGTDENLKNEYVHGGYYIAGYEVD